MCVVFLRPAKPSNKFDGCYHKPAERKQVDRPATRLGAF